MAISLLHTRKCTIAQAWANDIILITSIIVRGARQDDTKTTIMLRNWWHTLQKRASCSSRMTEQQLDCALDLMRRLPPQQIEKNLSDLIDLVSICQIVVSAKGIISAICLIAISKNKCWELRHRIAGTGTVWRPPFQCWSTSQNSSWQNSKHEN